MKPVRMRDANLVLSWVQFGWRDSKHILTYNRMKPVLHTAPVKFLQVQSTPAALELQAFQNQGTSTEQNKIYRQSWPPVHTYIQYRLYYTWHTGRTEQHSRWSIEGAAATRPPARVQSFVFTQDLPSEAWTDAATGEVKKTLAAAAPALSRLAMDLHTHYTASRHGVKRL
jgi:hypothetical protein